MGNEIIFENTNYAVYTCVFQSPLESQGATYREGYAVVNKNTGIREIYTHNYPDAVGSAEQLDLAVEHAVWKWMRIEQEANLMENEDGQAPDEVH